MRHIHVHLHDWNESEHPRANNGEFDIRKSNQKGLSTSRQNEMLKGVSLKEKSTGLTYEQHEAEAAKVIAEMAELEKTAPSSGAWPKGLVKKMDALRKLKDEHRFHANRLKGKTG